MNLLIQCVSRVGQTELSHGDLVLVLVLVQYCLKSVQKRLKNNYLSLLIHVHDTLWRITGKYRCPKTVDLQLRRCKINIFGRFCVRKQSRGGEGVGMGDEAKYCRASSQSKYQVDISLSLYSTVIPRYSR